MPHYSVLSIIRPSCSPSLFVSLSRQLLELISSSGGVFRSIDNFGLRPLAFRMRSHRRYDMMGKYIRFTFQVNPNTLAAIEKALKMDENVVRFMVTKEKTIAPVTKFDLNGNINKKIRDRVITTGLVENLGSLNSFNNETDAEEREKQSDKNDLLTQEMTRMVKSEDEIFGSELMGDIKVFAEENQREERKMMEIKRKQWDEKQQSKEENSDNNDNSSSSPKSPRVNPHDPSATPVSVSHPREALDAYVAKIVERYRLISPLRVLYLENHKGRKEKKEGEKERDTESESSSPSTSDSSSSSSLSSSTSPSSSSSTSPSSSSPSSPLSNRLILTPTAKGKIADLLQYRLSTLRLDEFSTSNANNVTFPLLNELLDEENKIENAIVSDSKSLLSRQHQERSLFEKQKEFLSFFNEKYFAAQKKEQEQMETMGKLGRNVQNVIEDTKALKLMAMDIIKDEGKKEEVSTSSSSSDSPSSNSTTVSSSPSSTPLVPELSLYQSSRLLSRIKNTSQLLFSAEEMERSLYRDFKFRLNQFVQRAVKDAKEGMGEIRQRGLHLLRDSTYYTVANDKDEKEIGEFRKKLIRANLKNSIHIYIKTALQSDKKKIELLAKYIQEYHHLVQVDEKNSNSPSFLITDTPLLHVGVDNLLELFHSSVDWHAGEKDNILKDPRAFEVINIIREQKGKIKVKKEKKMERMKAEEEAKRFQEVERMKNASRQQAKSA